MAIPPLKFQVQVVTTQAQQAVTNLKKYLEHLEKQFKAVDKAKNPDQWKLLDKQIKSVTASIKNLSSTMTQLNNTGKNTSNTFMNITRYFTSFLLVQKLVTGIREATRAFIEFQKTIAMNSALMQGGTEAMRKMQQQALDLGKTTVFTANQVAELQTQLIKLGVTTTEALEPMTKAVVNLAAAAGEDLATAGEIVYSVLNQYQIEAIHATEVSDIMSKALVESAMDLNSLAYSLKYAGTSANMLGLSMVQTTAMLELLSSVGIKGSSAGTSLNAMFIEMTKSSSKLTKETGIVVKSFDDIIKTFQSLDEKGIGAAKMFDLLNIRAARAAGNMSNPQMLKKLDLFLAGLGDPGTIKKLTEEYEKLSALKLDPVKDAVAVERLKDLTEALYEVNTAGEIVVVGGEKVKKVIDGYASDTASKAINSVAGDLQLLTSNLTNLGIELLNSKNGPIRDFVQGINEVVNGLRVFITGVGESSEKIQKWIGIIYEVAKAWLAFYAASKFTQFATWVTSGVGAIKNLGTQLVVLGGGLKAAVSKIGHFGLSMKSFRLTLALSLKSWQAFWTGVKASNPLGWVLLLLDAIILAGKQLVKLFTDAEKAKARAERKQNREDINGMISDYDKLIKKNKQAFDDRGNLNTRQQEDLKRSLEEEISLREDLDTKIRQLGQDKLKDDVSYQVFLATQNRIKNGKMLSDDQNYYDKNKELNEWKLKNAEKLAMEELKITTTLSDKQLNVAKDNLQKLSIEVQKSQAAIAFDDPRNIVADTGLPGSTPKKSATKTSGSRTLPAGFGTNKNKEWEDDMMRLLDMEAKIAETRRDAQKDNDKLVEDAYEKRKKYFKYEETLLNNYVSDEQKRLEELQRIYVKLEELQTNRTQNLETASNERRRILERDIKLQGDILDNDLEQVKEYNKQRKRLLEADTLSDTSKTTLPMTDLDLEGIKGQFNILNEELQIESEELKDTAYEEFGKATEKIGIEYAKRINEIQIGFLDYEKTAQNFINTLESKKAMSYNSLTEKELEFLGKQKSDLIISEEEKLKLSAHYSSLLMSERTRTANEVQSLEKEKVEEDVKARELWKQNVTADEKYVADKTELYRRQALTYIQDVQTQYKSTLMNMYNENQRGPNIEGKLGAQGLDERGRLSDVEKQQAEALKQLGSAKMKELGLYQYYDDMKTAILEKGEKERQDIILQGISEYVGMVQESIGILSEIVSTQKQMEQDAIDARYESEIRAAEQRQETLIQQYGLKNKKEEQMTAAQKRKLEKINLQAEEAREKAEKEKEQRSLDLKKKYANKEFAIQIANIITNSALSIMKLWANPGFPLAIPMTALVGALAITQIAAAKKQKDSVQNLATGGEVYGPSHSNGGVPVELEGGEIVINKRSSSLPWVKNLALGLNAIGNNKVSNGRIMADGGQVRTSSASQVSAVSEETLRIIVQEVVAGTSAIPIVNTALDTTNLSDSVKKVRNRTTW